MQWTEFQPYVLPYVIGCPDPVLEHHAKMAAIAFCQRTLCLSRTLDPEFTNGVDGTLEFFPDSGLQIVKIKSVAVDGKTWPLVNTSHGQELARSNSTADFAFGTGQSTVEVYPVQAAGVSVVVDAAIAPTMTATACPDDLRQYLQDIAHGAAASIMLIPGQVFTNYDHSRERSTAFNSRIATVSAKVARGLTGAKMRSRATFI